MDKETLSNYGWIVICVLVLAVMIALATPFGTFVADGFKATYTGLFQTGDNALDVGLNAVGVSNKLPCGHGRKEAGDHSQKECGHYNCQDTDCECVPASCGVEGHWSGDGKDHTTKVYHTSTSNYETPHRYACQCVTGWIVPEGGTYYSGVTGDTLGDYTGGTVYNAGEPVMTCMRKGDVYVQGDYEYRFAQGFNYNFEDWSTNTKKTPTGWGVRVLDKTKTQYEPLLESINGKPLKYMESTFSRCNKITDFSDFVIPDTVTSMWYAFTSSSITSAPLIPSNVTSYTYLFVWCRSLTGTITLPCTMKIDKFMDTPAAVSHYHVNGCDGSCGY